MKRLIECVPNFSEGRDLAKVSSIVEAMRSVPGVYVLDQEMDADHNRCVITLAGDPDAVGEASLLGAGRAMELIDMNVHTGAHPRVGATDVVPFIPIEGVTIEACVALARRVGYELWKRYRIPVFFYEAAAMRPDRVNLENIRRGQFEAIREEIATVEKAGADWIHIDVMDGHFVPNITIGPAIISTLRKTTKLPFDVHLMIENPERYIESFAQAGANIITVHVEATNHLHRTIDMIKKLGREAGVSLNPATPLTQIEEIIPYIDLLLIMTVNPGFGGQQFIKTSLSKIARANKMLTGLSRKPLLEVD